MNKNLRKIFFFLIAIFSYQITFAMQDSWQILGIDPSSNLTEREILYAYHDRLFQDSNAENKLGKEIIRNAYLDVAKIHNNTQKILQPANKDIRQDNLSSQEINSLSEVNNEHESNNDSMSNSAIENISDVTPIRRTNDQLRDIMAAIEANRNVLEENEKIQIRINDCFYKGPHNNIEEFLHSNYGLNLAQYIENEYGSYSKLENNDSEKLLSNVRKEHLATLRNEFLSKLKILTSVNLINYLYELYRIKNIGSQNKKSIDRSAKLGMLSNIFSIAKLPLHVINKIANKIVPFNKIQVKDNALSLAKISWILPSLAAINFDRKDMELAKNAETIANYNKETNRSITKTKFIQGAWLSLNKVLPYAGYIYSRIKNDNVNISEVFTGKHNFGTSFYTFVKLKALADISEIVRKHYRYKAELGNYKNFVKQSA